MLPTKEGIHGSVVKGVFSHYRTIFKHHLYMKEKGKQIDKYPLRLKSPSELYNYKHPFGQRTL